MLDASCDFGSPACEYVSVSSNMKKLFVVNILYPVSRTACLLDLLNILINIDIKFVLNYSQ
jgi:hypothetical protein